jgi:hypothetical protein
MKEHDPQVTVHLAGLTYWHDVAAGRSQYLDRLLKVVAADPEAAGHDYFFDVLSLHIYFRTESVPAIIAEMDAIQHQHGLDKPIWINETNAAPTLDPLWPVERPQFQVDLEQQAWFLVQAHALAFAAGVESIGVYKFSDVLVEPGGESFGLLRADFGERPAFQAHRTLIRQLRGFTGAVDSSSHDYHLVTFTHPDRITRVLWTQNPASLTMRLPALGPGAILVDALGNETSLTGTDGGYELTLEGARCYADCIIGGPPVFVVERGGDLKGDSAPRVLSRTAVTPVPDMPTTTSPPAGPSPWSWLLLGLLLLSLSGFGGLALLLAHRRRRKS